jgi:hypothetical protein
MEEFFMLSGRMYCLDEVLQTENQSGSRYILMGEGEWEGKVFFGRNRSVYVPKECYIVLFSGSSYELEKLEFDSDGNCDYLKVLKERKVAYEIPKSLPKSYNRMYTRFECAIGDTHWSRYINGFFGANGYAITDVGYIGDDRYESYEINLAQNPGSFHIGENSILEMTGEGCPKAQFIEKLLEENVQVEEGEPVITMLKEAGLEQYIEYTRFETEE